MLSINIVISNATPLLLNSNFLNNIHDNINFELSPHEKMNSH